MSTYRVACLEEGCEFLARTRIGRANAKREARAHVDETGHDVRASALMDGMDDFLIEG